MAEQRAGSQRRGDRPVRSDGRVPPHNLQAEESVLGALLLSRDAIGVVSEQGLQPSDFYRPAHQHVYDAIRALYSSGAPVDTVTVADELRRAGLLDEVGGTGALHELQNATPAISSAGHYAKIVQDTAMLRRLIYVAGDIAELAYGEPDDVTKALDEAESKVFAVAEQRVTDSTRQIDELLSEAMDRLQETFDRGDTITGSATGYHDLDELLSGLQASALYIVGARPAMGKCVAWDTPIVDTDTGEVVNVDEMMRRATARGRLGVLAVDGSHRLVSAEAGAMLDDGLKPVFEVTTRTGRRIVVTASHPFLTAQGWRRLDDIAVGDPIAVPHHVPVFGTDDLPDAEIDLLADHCGDRLPPAIFRLPRPRLARFLNRLYATDGSAWVSRPGSGRIAYAATSSGLAADVAHVLLRFGIRSTVRTRHVRYRDGRVRAYEVEVRDALSLIRFADEIGILGKDAAVARVRDVASASCRGRSADTVPIEAWDDVMKAKGPLSWREINRRTGRSLDHNWHAFRGRLQRSTVAELAEALDDDTLRRWASPDVCWDDVVSITSAGWTRVIDFTVPAFHNFVAADMCLHNTAFGLGMATHIAQHSQKPVLVFSLEMGHAELTQRIISSEARVDSTRIRTGRLAEADWAKIGKAIGRLEVPLFLDDNPRVTVMEIRAKARRIKARYGGLALIVIDYLQLMSGGGNPENRQLEVSEISRSLKILARELEVPIVALSQLSRNLESRSDKRPMLSDLRESGCLTADTRLVRADTNAEITLGELVERRHERIPVWSLDDRMRLVPGVVSNAFSSGVKDTFRLRLASGRWVEASASHPFLTVDGWRRLDQLLVGDAIASARRIPPAAGERSMSDPELVLLGHLIGDGCTLQRHALQYTTTDPENVAAVVGAASFFGVTARVKAERSCTQVYLPSPSRLTHGRHHPVAAWLRGLGTWDLRSWEKVVPQPVFSQPPAAIAMFLRHLWATDGSVVVPAEGGRGAPRIYYATTSRRLADDVAALLLRLDIRARIRTVPHRTHRCSYHVDVSGRTDQLRFAEIVGVHGSRGERLRHLVAHLAGRRANPNVDVPPRSVWTHVRRISMPSAQVSARTLAQRLGMRYCGSTLYASGLSRERAARVAEATHDPWLRELATSDVLWDQVVAIEPLGPQPVFDATVDGTHNFVANGIIAHNSLEQDADVVMFLYRDEVYNPESPDKGSAEVIVAKHRSGPIGTKRLVFLGQYTRFDNAARGV